LGTCRAHWGVENRLHWVLDVAFLEDQSRIRLRHAAENMATIRKIALNTIKKNTTRKASARAKTKLAGWEDDFLKDILLEM
jgi:predicted transposase YbfD/YdcC